MVVGDRPGPGLAPGEQRGADALPAKRRIEQADDVIRPTAVGLVAPLHAGIPGDPSVELDDQQVPIPVGVGQVVVEIRERLDGHRLLDADGESIGHVGAGHAGVVLGTGEVPEPEARDGRPGCEELGFDHRPSLPYLSSMCLLTDLWIVFHRRRSSARARASTRRSRWRASRSSFCQPSNRDVGEVAVLDRGHDRAAGLAVVGAVREPADRGQRLDVGERPLETGLGLPRGELAHARGVEDEAAGRQQVQLAAGRRVPAPGVVLPDVLHGRPGVAGERVEERRLADARRPDERDRRAGLDPLPDRVDAAAVDGRGRHDRHADRDLADLRHEAVEILGEVRLGQHDDRLGAALPGDREVALEAPQVEVLVERRDDEDDVDVRRHDLGDGPLARREPDDRGPPWHDGPDLRRAIGAFQTTQSPTAG